MPSTGDRILRILSDGPRPAGPDPSLPRKTLQTVLIPAELRARLGDLEAGTQARARIIAPRRSLGADAGPDPLPLDLPGLAPPAEPPARPASGTPAMDLEDLVGGHVRQTSQGEFLEVEQRIALSATHGRFVLADALRYEVPLREQESDGHRLRALHPTQAVFLDTETTGLAGGTGTVAFLVGAGFVQGEDFVVRQYFLRDFPEEGALLNALREDLGDRPLVSFNGRSFDWPLLTTRWRLNRKSNAGSKVKLADPTPQAHLDLLLTARRLWASTLHSHALSALERHVLGVARGEDLSGWQIPVAWFSYLRGEDRTRVAQAFRHNCIDVVSMLALMGEVGRILSAPGAQMGAPGDRLGTARLLLELGDDEGARACLRAGVDEASGAQQRPLHMLLGWMERRSGHDVRAQGHFEAAAALSLPEDVSAHEHVAKLLEHRRRDLAGALQWTERAMERAPLESPAASALEHRAKRLRRRMQRQDRLGPAAQPTDA